MERRLQKPIRNEGDYDKILDEVMTTSEACTRWGLSESTLRNAIRYNRLKEDVEYRKSGKVWLITKEAMLRLYGEE